jgi:hypothetical protein
LALGRIGFSLIFLRWRSEWGMHACFPPRPRPSGRVFSDVSH